MRVLRPRSEPHARALRGRQQHDDEVVLRRSVALDHGSVGRLVTQRAIGTAALTFTGSRQTNVVNDFTFGSLYSACCANASKSCMSRASTTSMKSTSPVTR